MASLVRPIQIFGNIAHIPLTKGYTATIDSCDVRLVDSWNWLAVELEHTVYAARHQRTNGVKRCIYLHRAILSEASNMQVDHISGDGLDNRRSNLRLVTPSQNQRNQRISKANKTGFKGVYATPCGRKWRATIKVSGKSIGLGTYSSPERAHQAYIAASARLHGEYGRTR